MSERTFLEKFITKARPLDWITLKEESSYLIPIPNLLKYLAVIQAFLLASVVIFGIFFGLFNLASGGSTGGSEVILYVILFFMIIGGNMLSRFLTITKPKNWKKHLHFIILSLNTLLVIVPLWYWYFYRRPNVAEYYKQFEVE